MTPEKIETIRERLKEVTDDSVGQLFALAMAEIKRRGALLRHPSQGGDEHDLEMHVVLQGDRAPSNTR